MSSLTIVVAAAENNVIGRGNQLPWRLPDDLKRFKEITLGKPVVMGRKTWDSIGKPLPGRTNIIVSRQPELAIPGCVVVGSMNAALVAARGAPEIMLIGGAQLYRNALSMVRRIHLTRVHADINGDTLFPILDPAQWRETVVGTHPADERHAHAFTFITLDRIPSHE